MIEEKQAGLAVKKTNAFKKDPDVIPEVLPKDDQEEKTIIKAESDDKNEKESHLEFDPEALLNSDPEENMEGPISSIMQTIKKAGESNDVISKEEANKKKEENN